MGGSETVGGDQDGLHTTAVHVPIGWQRRVEGSRVVYISPSGTSLSSLDEVKTYLLSDGTCKCGLECPLVLHKVFNFALGVKVEQCSHPVGKVEQDMTKLCNHRRKVVAMAALCRSMQASQLPFSTLHHPEVSSGLDSCHPKRPHGERIEDHPKLHPVPGRAHNTCVSPPLHHRFIYPQNGSSPNLHSTNHHFPLDSIRRLHNPSPLPPCSAPNQSFSGYRSPRTPTSHGPGQRTPKTPDTPGSPRFRPLASPPPSSSPMTLAGVRPLLSHVRFPSAALQASLCLSLPCVGAWEVGGRRKSSSSSPHSPLPCASPNTNTHFPKYKLEDILEQFKNSGSANNHHLPFPINSSLLSSQSHQPLSQKPTHSRVPCPTAYGLSSSGPPNSHMPFGNHHNHNRPHQSSFPASSLLSAAAKAQLVNQITQGQAANVGSPSVSADSSLEAMKEAQQQQHKSKADGVDALIPLSLQGKDNPILQQLLPTLLNTAVLGDLSNMAGFQNMMGLGAGSILLPPVQASALGMPLLQGPDGTINLLNNLQLSIATSSEEEKPISMETASPAPQPDIPASPMAPEVQTPEVPSPAPEPPVDPPKTAGPKPVIDPYTSFMDTIYTSFLQVSAREQEEGARSGPSDPTSPFCALPPVSFPLETLSPPAPLSQASAPAALSPRRACSLRNPDLSRLSLEAAAHSPAQGTPRPTEDGPVSLLHRKSMPIYLEEAQTDCTRPAAVCPYTDTAERKRLLPPAGYLSPGERCREDTPGTMLLEQHTSDAIGGLGEARRGRKRKQLLQNVLEDFRELDTAALDESEATTTLLKSDRSVRGRRRRGTRSQRQ
ncbi:hypothetical protein WMY93_027473 [Mugilogobius chulae]|uniref:MBD domain-containing protein n=1 Tax=Mugilogobius chulae TaxID=88201 RepID=A0AAW0N3Z8_9GOBI